MELGEATLTIERAIQFVHDDPALVESLTRLRDGGLLKIVGRWPPEGSTADSAELQQYRDVLRHTIAEAAKGNASPELQQKLKQLLLEVEVQLQGDESSSPDAASYDDHGDSGDEDGAPGIVGPWDD